MITSRLDKNRKVSQIHYGGGTPIAVPVEYLQEINNLLLSNFQFITEPEIAIEVNPAYLTYEQMAGLKKAGFKPFQYWHSGFQQRRIGRCKPRSGCTSGKRHYRFSETRFAQHSRKPRFYSTACPNKQLRTSQKQSRKPLNFDPTDW